MSKVIKIGDKNSLNLDEIPNNPGIYKFLNLDKEIIYIGKAKNLSKRIKSYFYDSGNKSKKLRSLVNEVNFLELIITSSELEALLLEQHEIKEKLPKFNVQFKDDKGYPWIVIEITKEYPAIRSFQGSKKKNELYFGPFPNAKASREALNLIQKVFKLRDCNDTFFKNRTRPCIQYEIGKCSGPCVSAIKKEDYLEDVKSSKILLQGGGENLIKKFYDLMDKSAKRKLYERAASYRDKISSLRDIQRTQSIGGFSVDRDAVVIYIFKEEVKVGITSVRGGWIVKHENFTKVKGSVDNEIISSFVLGHYLYTKYCPPVILIKEDLVSKGTIQQALTKKHGKKIKIITRPNKKDQGLLEICNKNTKFSLKRRKKSSKDLSAIFRELERQFGLKNKLNLIESYDISHHSGKNATGGCVAFNTAGKYRDLYRVYNIKESNSGNDIASMKEIISRRFSLSNIKNSPIPDLLLIDGGYNHLKAVREEVDHLGIKDIEVISISKGSRRKPEMDLFHKEDKSVIKVEKDSKSHLFLQAVRDETHRFSISKQRRKYLKLTTRSHLDSFSGIGKKKKSALLRYFGSVDQISKASSQDLLKVPKIGKRTAEIIIKNLS